LKNRNGKPERGSEWEPIKILLEEVRGSNKMNTASNTRLQTPNPRKMKTLKSSPFAHEFGRGIIGKKTTKGSCIHPPTNP
jgi:hypothetical protein